MSGARYGLADRVIAALLASPFCAAFFPAALVIGDPLFALTLDVPNDFTATILGYITILMIGWPVGIILGGLSMAPFTYCAVILTQLPILLWVRRSRPVSPGAYLAISALLGVAMVYLAVPFQIPNAEMIAEPRYPARPALIGLLGGFGLGAAWWAIVGSWLNKPERS